MNTLSDHSRIFDKRNPNWYDEAVLSRIFIQAQENYANQLLIVHGYVFLNDVYKMLGLKLSKDGHIVGWLKQPGSNRVEISMVMKDEGIILDFNVDGEIYDLVEWDEV